MKGAVCMTACFRPERLKKTLATLAEVDGIKDWYLYVLSDSDEPGVIEILKTDVPRITPHWQAGANWRTLGPAKNSQKVVRMAVNEGADVILYMQDDVDVSPDILKLTEWFYRNGDGYLGMLMHNYDPEPDVRIIYETRGDEAIAVRRDWARWHSPCFAITAETFKERLDDIWVPRGDQWFLSFQGQLSMLLEDPENKALVPAMSRAQHSGWNDGMSCKHWNARVYGGHSICGVVPGNYHLVRKVRDRYPEKRQATRVRPLLDALDEAHERFGRVRAVEIGAIKVTEKIDAHSMGWSTLFAANVAKEGWLEYHSVDLDTSVCAEVLDRENHPPPIDYGHLRPYVTLHEVDGLSFMRDFEGPLHVLYLDLSNDPFESAAIMLEALAKMPDGSFVCADDFDENCSKGDVITPILDAMDVPILWDSKLGKWEITNEMRVHFQELLTRVMPLRVPFPPDEGEAANRFERNNWKRENGPKIQAVIDEYMAATEDG